MAIRWKDLLVFALGENMLTRLDQVRCIELYPDVLSFVTAPSLGTALTPLDSAMVAEWHSGVRSGEPFQLEDTDKDQDTFETVQRHKVCMKEPVARTVIVTCASLRIKEMPLAHLSESIIDVLISQ